MQDACAEHTAYLFDRGGLTRIGELGPLISLQWGRLRDDISTGQVVMKNPDCTQIASQVEAGRHELVIFRGGERVWEGPITLVTYQRDTTTIDAKDVMHYTERLIMKGAYDNSYHSASKNYVDFVVQRCLNILTGELARREAENPPINMLPYVHAIIHDGDARTSRNTVPYQSTVFSEIDDMAAKAGVDYFVLGRSLYLYDTDYLIGQTPVMTEADIVGDVIVSEYGMNLATLAAVSGANGQYGEAGGVDPYYGWIEVLASAYDENADSDEDAPSIEALNDQAQRNLNGRNPTPVTVRIPDGSTLNPGSPIRIEHLVPGMGVPLRATMTGRTFSQMQKIDVLTVNEDENGETIQITLSPTDAVGDPDDGGDD